jgi:hypothetical protein
MQVVGKLQNMQMEMTTMNIFMFKRVKEVKIKLDIFCQDLRSFILDLACGNKANESHFHASSRSLILGLST